jgi:hypothetical protein
MVRSAGSSRLRSSAGEAFEEALKSRRTVAEGQENNRGLLKGVLEEVRGSRKNFTVSEPGDRGGSQKTITPSSLR